MRRFGYTLIELLVVIAILAILILSALSMVGNRRDVATDAKTKSELQRLKIALEDYYADNNCYPPSTFFDSSSDCNSTQLSPYLNSFPCDKSTGAPYEYETDSTGCSWFKLYARLKAPHKDAEALSLCDPSGSSLGNYVIHSENVSAKVVCSNSATTQPSPSGATPIYLPGHQYTYCNGGGNCTVLPSNLSCTPYYTDNADCDGCPSGPSQCTFF